ALYITQQSAPPIPNHFPYTTLFRSILQIPYGILANRIKNRMILITIGALSNRLCWVLIAFIPFLVRAELAVPAVIILATLRVIRSEEHTSELQSRENLVCLLLL